MGVSQGDPKTLDDAIKLALKLESIHLTEELQNLDKINMAAERGLHIEPTTTMEDAAAVHMAGASFKDDDVAPKWAQKVFEQQTRFLAEITSVWQRGQVVTGEIRITCATASGIQDILREIVD